MILPSKHIRPQSSLLLLSANLLAALDAADGGLTVSGLWESSVVKNAKPSFVKFVYALDLLYGLGKLQMNENGHLRKV